MNVNKALSSLSLMLLLIFALSACSASAVQTPTRAIAITTEEALAGQTALLAGFTTGQAEVTESQFSSFLTKLLEANSGPNQPVEAITAWFEPAQLYLRLTLKDGVLAPNLGKTVDLVGGLTINNGVLQIELQEAAAGPYHVSGALLQPIASQINAALAQQVSALPLEVALERGALHIRIVQ